MRLNLEAKSDNEIAILAYLEENASEALAEKINSGKKTMTGCIGYITGQARKRAKNGMAMIKDVEVFGWAVHYFEEEALNNEPAKIEKTVKEERTTEDNAVFRRTSSSSGYYEKKEKKAPEPKKKETKNEQLDGQLDMFELMGGM